MFKLRSGLPVITAISGIGTVLMIVLVALALLGATEAHGQNPTGANDWPLWTRGGQGSTALYGAVSCDADGAIFLNTKSSYRTSVVIINTHATQSVAICPTGSSGSVIAADSAVTPTDCGYSVGLLLAGSSSVTLDRSVLATGAAGFTCFADTGQTTIIRFYAEQ